MLTPLWKSLSLLASHDFELKKLEQILSSYDSKNKELSLSLANLEQEHNEDEHLLKKLQRSIKQLEQRLQELEHQETTKKNYLTTCLDQKEYQAIKKELQTLEAQSQKEEENLIRAWMEQERFEKKYKEKQSDFSSKKQEALTLQEENRVQQEKEKAVYHDKLEERKKLLETIPEKWQIIYDSMKNKVQNPIVALTNGACSACFYPILQHEKMSLKTNHIMHCHSCYRLIYYVED